MLDLSRWRNVVAALPCCVFLFSSFCSSPTEASTVEVPLRADSLVNSAGININLATLPSSADATVASLTKALGIRHIRTPLLKNDPMYDAVLNKFLDLTGVRVLGLTDCALPLGFYAQAGIVAANIRAFQTALGGRLEAYEAVNEPDTRLPRDPSWASDTLSCMQSQAGAIAGIPYLAPAIANEEAYASKVGDVSALVDRANIHRYFSGNNPGTAGWGNINSCGVYGSLIWAECEASINAPRKPKIITETGYNSDSEVDETTQAKYLSRELFVNMQAGVQRTYIYCMNSYLGGDGFGGSGLLDVNLAPKPAFTAIAHVLALFQDPGSDANPRAPLAYAVMAQASTIRHELFQKRDGTFLLALWNETSSWNKHTRHIVVPQSVGISLPFTPSTSYVTALDDRGNFAAVSLTSQAGTISFPVDDHLAVLAFKR